MLKKFLLGFAVVFLAFAAYVSTRPSEFTITRSMVIGAPPERIFPYVNDLTQWRSWSPWEEKDPAMKRTYSGPSAGPGASYAWAGNSDVGEGKMTITEAKPPESIHIRLEFFKPMAAVSPTEFMFQPETGGTKVTWKMSGTNNFIGKAMCLFMDMDKMVGGDFEKGLTALKGLAEAGKWRKMT